MERLRAQAGPCYKKLFFHKRRKNPVENCGHYESLNLADFAKGHPQIRVRCKLENMFFTMRLDVLVELLAQILEQELVRGHQVLQGLGCSFRA